MKNHWSKVTNSRSNWDANEQKRGRKCFLWRATGNEVVAIWIRPSPSGREFYKKYPVLKCRMNMITWKVICFSALGFFDFWASVENFLLIDPRRDDTDVDNGFSKHEEDEEKIRRLFKLRRKPETPAEEKWTTLLKMVPKTSPKINVKDSSSTTSSLKDDSSAPSEIIPEIKISRVQTMENILKTDNGTKSKQQRKSSQSSEKEKTKGICLSAYVL